MKKDNSQKKAAMKAAIISKLKSLAVPVILCAVIFALVYVVMTFKDEEVEEEASKIKRYEGSEELMIMENDDLLFTLDPLTTQFTIEVKDTGKIWYSNPADAAENPLIASESERAKLQSTLLMTYSEEKGLLTTYDNYKYSIEKGIYDIEQGSDEKGEFIRVNYSIGNVQREYYIPPVTTADKFEEWVSKMEPKYAQYVRDYYTKYDINNLRKKDQDKKDQLLADYPIIAEQVIYVLNPNTQQNLKVTFEEVFASIGYTMDDYKADCALSNASATTKTPIFGVSMVYRLDGDEFVLEVPYEAVHKYAPSLFNSLKEQAPDVWSYSYYEGKNYGVPNVNQGHLYAHIPQYRQDWLENVGLDIPETLDELHDVLKAFTFDDPDGNGKNDTYGYAPNSTHYSGWFIDIFGAYGLLPFDWQYVDDEVVYGAFRPETLEALTLLNQWYNEGILYPGWIEVDKTGPALFKENKVGYIYGGSLINPDDKNDQYNIFMNTYPGSKIAYGELPKGPEGKSGTRGWGIACHIASFGAVDEQSPVKATRILKMFEGMFTDEDLLKEVLIGKEGVVYNYDDTSKGHYRLKFTEDYDESAELRLAGYTQSYGGPSFWVPFGPRKDFLYEQFSDAHATWRNTYGDTKTVLADAFYKPDIVPSAPTYIADLQNGQAALMTKVITGELPVEKFTEEFQKLWDATGGPQMMEEAKAQKDINDSIVEKINSLK